MVTTTFSTQDSLLLISLLTSSARVHALRAHGGHCLNCNSTDHSMKTCPQDFLNISGILNPALGQLNDGGHAYVNGNNGCVLTAGASTSITSTETPTATPTVTTTVGALTTTTTGAPTTTTATITTTPTNTGATTDAPTTDATTTAAPTTMATDSRKGSNFNNGAPQPQRSRQPGRYTTRPPMPPQPPPRRTCGSATKTPPTPTKDYLAPFAPTEEPVVEQLQHLRQQHLLRTPGLKTPEYTTRVTPPCPCPPTHPPYPSPISNHLCKH